MTYTTSSTPTHILTNKKGCDSTVTLNLTINNATIGDTTATACTSFKWYGMTYTTSSTPSHILTNKKGCDSTVTLNLTINNATTGDTTATACTSFKWYGTAYTVSGTPTHILTNKKGCDSTVTLNLTITTVPANAGSAQSIYPGDSTTLTATGGTAYIWSNGGINATTSVKPATTTTYTVTVYNMSGCSAFADVIVTVKPTPTTPVISTVGSDLLSNASSGNQWYVNGTILTGQTNALCVPSVTGYYCVIVTQTGCPSDTSNKIYVVVTGLNELSDNKDFYIYPNPVTDNLQIQTTLPIKEIEITDITGRLLYTTTAKTINCSSFAKGVYFIKVTTSEGAVVKKFIKE